MKITPPLAFSLVSLGFCWTYPLRTYAQSWTPAGPAAITTNYTFATVGGISYFTHTSHTLTCYRVYSGLPSISGTNLWAIVEKEHWTGPCIAPIPDLGHDETHTIVLGALDPGDYALTLYAYAPPLYTQLLAYRTFLFSAPEPVLPTLQASATDSNLNLTVQGVTNAIYTIQTSSDLTNWTTAVTQTNAPFEWSEPLDTNTSQKFYRVQINGQ